MSIDIDLYEDDHIGISATLGHWGVRLSVDQKQRDPKYPNAVGLMGDILTQEKLENLIKGFQQVKEHLSLLSEEG
jgi:hypothetical protein